jgi:hypothetical protein
MRMAEMRGDVDLAEEAIATDCRRELGVEHLYRDLAIVLPVIGKVHGGHSAAADFPRDVVPVSEDGSQAFEQVNHGS